MSITRPHPSARRALGRLFSALVLTAALGLSPLTAGATPHDPQESGHPVRIAAYVLHPIGVLLDTLIMRPAHWLVHRGPLLTLFGHES